MTRVAIPLKGKEDNFSLNFIQRKREDPSLFPGIRIHWGEEHWDCCFRNSPDALKAFDVSLEVKLPLTGWIEVKYIHMVRVFDSLDNRGPDFVN